MEDARVGCRFRGKSGLAVVCALWRLSGRRAHVYVRLRGLRFRIGEPSATANDELDPCPMLFWQCLSGAAEFSGQISEFRQPVLHGNHFILIVHVHGRLVSEALQKICIHIHEVHTWVISHKMAAARFAEFSVRMLSLVKTTDVRFTLGDLDAIRRPERKSINRRSRPALAVFAMAIPHYGRRASRFKFYLTAKADASVHVLHGKPLPSLF